MKKIAKETPPPPDADTLGRKFAVARLALGLTIEDAAHILRMRVSLVRDIEADDLRNFSHPSYARLSLLDYARMLRIPESEIRQWLPDPGSSMTEHCQYLDNFSDPVPSARRSDVLEETRKQTPLAGIVKFVLFLAILGIGASLTLLVVNLSRIQTGAPTGTPPPDAGLSGISAPSAPPLAPPPGELQPPPNPEEERRWLDDGSSEAVFTGIAIEPEAPPADPAPVTPLENSDSSPVGQGTEPDNSDAVEIRAATPIVP